MAGMYGADVEQLRTLASQFSQAADQLDRGRLQVGDGIRISAWVGPFATSFRIRWDSESSLRIAAAARRLREAARVLRANADEQAQASASTGSVTRPSPVAGTAKKGPKAPNKAADYYRTLHGMNQKEDGVRVQKVLGADGVTRYVVYINGTFSAGDGTFGVLDNAPGAYSLDSATVISVRKKIKDAMKDDPSAEVMLVGYSQGGLVAQKLADEGFVNVQTVMTFGSPYLASKNNYGGADIIRLEHNADLVPLLSPTKTGRTAVVASVAAGVGVPVPVAATLLVSAAYYEMAAAVSSWASGVEKGLDTTFKAGNPLEGGLDRFKAHADPVHYAWVGDEFEKSSRPEDVAARESYARFNGVVIEDKL